DLVVEPTEEESVIRVIGSSISTLNYSSSYPSLRHCSNPQIEVVPPHVPRHSKNGGCCPCR
ncbi:unnamed protein product, partial [Allacma fusca]